MTQRNNYRGLLYLLFKVSVASYALFTVLEIVSLGFVTMYFDLKLILVTTLISGLAIILTPDPEQQSPNSPSSVSIQELQPFRTNTNVPELEDISIIINDLEREKQRTKGAVLVKRHKSTNTTQTQRPARLIGQDVIISKNDVKPHIARNINDVPRINNR